jgi:hypothetical protein
MIAQLLLISLLSAGGEPAQGKLHTLAGQTVDGGVVRLTDREVVIAQGDQEQVFAPAALRALEFPKRSALAAAPVQVGLVDGSLLQAAVFTLAEAKAKVTLPDRTTHEIPGRLIAWVRFRGAGGDLDTQWNQFQGEESTADRLIVRRKGSPDGEPAVAPVETLDAMEGVIGDVTTASIAFEFDGDTLNVKRERVEGMLFLRSGDSALPAAACYAVDQQGSRWAVKSLELAGDTLKLATATGLSLELPLVQLQKIDYAASNVQYLSELVPERSARTSWLQPDDATANSGEESPPSLFQPLSGRTPEGVITVGGNTFTQGMWMPAKSSMIVRIPAGFQRFQAQVGIDDRVNGTDGARLLIEGDGKVLFDQVMGRQSQPTPVDVPLAGARRVRITVDYGGESFLGDQLVLCEAMFTK